MCLRIWQSPYQPLAIHSTDINFYSSSIATRFYISIIQFSLASIEIKNGGMCKVVSLCASNTSLTTGFLSSHSSAGFSCLSHFLKEHREKIEEVLLARFKGQEHDDCQKISISNRFLNWAQAKKKCQSWKSICLSSKPEARFQRSFRFAFYLKLSKFSINNFNRVFTLIVFEEKPHKVKNFSMSQKSFWG